MENLCILLTKVLSIKNFYYMLQGLQFENLQMLKAIARKPHVGKAEMWLIGGSLFEFLSIVICKQSVEWCKHIFENWKYLQPLTHFGFPMWCKKCTTSALKPFTFLIFQTEHSVACYSLENVAIHMMCCITEIVYLCFFVRLSIYKS